MAATLPRPVVRLPAERLRYSIALSHPRDAAGYVWSGRAESAVKAEELARVNYRWDTGQNPDEACILFMSVEIF